MLPTTTSTDLPSHIILASSGQVVRAEGTTVTFGDGVVAQCAASGLWGRTLDLPAWSSEDHSPNRARDGDRDEARLRNEAGFALRALVGPTRFPHAAFTRDPTGDRWVPGLLTAMRAGGLVDHRQTRAIWLGMLGTGTPPTFRLWHARADGGTDGPEEVAVTKLDELERDRHLVAVLLIDPAPVFGTRALPPDLVAAAVAGLTGPHSLVGFDQTNALLRNGQVLTHQEMAIEADLVTVGHQTVGTGDSHRAYALAPGLSLLTAAGHSADGPPQGDLPADLEADRAAARFHQALIRAVDIARSPLSRSQSLATAGLLAQGLAALVDDGLLARIDGGGWAWSITPVRPWGSGPDGAHPGELAEDLRQAGLWAPITANGGILLLPPVVSSSADVARIIDSLATVLGR